MEKMFLFVFLLVSMLACNKNTEPVTESDGKTVKPILEDFNCVFDWNDSLVPNCGPFTANVFVDGIFIGVWPGNWIDSVYDGLNFDDREYSKPSTSKVYAKLTPGEHTYSDRLYCGFDTFFSGSNSDYTGKFVVPDTGYVLVSLY